MLPLPPVTPEPHDRFLLDLGQNHRQVRDLEPLTASIRRNGVLQPVGAVLDPETNLLRPIWGFRRVLCGIQLKLPDIPTRVYPGPLQPGEHTRLSLIENIQRQDLKPSEEARAYRAYMDAEGITASDLAESLAVSEGKVSKKLSLLKLVESLLRLIDEGMLPETCGRELARLDPAAQEELAEEFRARGRVSRDQASATVQERLGVRPKADAKRVTLRLGGLGITLPSEDASLETLNAALDDLKRLIRKAQSEGHDLSALAKMLCRPSVITP